MSHKVFTEKNFTKSLINTFENLVALHDSNFVIPILTPEMIAIDKLPSINIKQETLHNYKRVEYMFEKNTIDISLFNSIAVMAGKKIQPVDNLISLFTSYLFLLGKIPTNEQINPYKYILELTKEVYTKLHLKPGDTMKVAYKTACRESLQKLEGGVTPFAELTALTLKYIIVYLYALDTFSYSCDHYDTLFIKRLLNNLQSKCSGTELINCVYTSNITLITPANNFKNIHAEHRKYLFKNSSSSPCKVCDIYEAGIKNFLQKAFSGESKDLITGYFIVSLLGLSKVLSSEKFLKFAAYLKLSESPEYIKYLNCYLNYNFKKYSKSMALFREYTLIDPLVTKSFIDYARIVK